MAVMMTNAVDIGWKPVVTVSGDQYIVQVGSHGSLHLTRDEARALYLALGMVTDPAQIVVDTINEFVTVDVGEPVDPMCTCGHPRSQHQSAGNEMVVCIVRGTEHLGCYADSCLQFTPAKETA